VMSLSASAVYCIQKAGSKRETANGWIMWKTQDGTYLSAFYDQLYAADEEGKAQEAQPKDTVNVHSAGQHG
jgi:hypothetical protein